MSTLGISIFKKLDLEHKILNVKPEMLIFQDINTLQRLLKCKPNSIINLDLHIGNLEERVLTSIYTQHEIGMFHDKL